MLLRFQLKHSLAVLAALKRRTRAAAVVTEAADAVAAVRAAARWFPGRAACLENSLVAALTTILTRRSVDWCIGVRLTPYAAHAWAEAEGIPVGEQVEPDRPFTVITRTRKAP
ncbi:lasso peptide biosynthesis B2 protein [Marinactinospora thermotolerans]|uniref:lasso peptide biosynthesis B2 protein n=1 Tax=Marinactinospora thermotolerans TaxID=531310 RepID=UPI0009999D2F|nr:lasso peptide biosynthesis B2 protein [Marinactinospora thermotolerans]